MSSDKKFPLSFKMNLLVICIILLVSGGLIYISYRFYSQRINNLYIGQVDRAAKAANDDIFPDAVDHLWKEINTDEFRKVYDEAVASNDENLILEWMKSRPSVYDSIDAELMHPDSEADEEMIEDLIKLEVDTLYTDYQDISQTLENCLKLFDISDAYIQYDEDGVTYNLVDPNENLFYIGTIEPEIAIFSDTYDNKYFPATIYHSEFGWLCTTLLPLGAAINGTIPGYVGIDTDMNKIVRQQRFYFLDNDIYIILLTGIMITLSMVVVHRIVVAPLHLMSQAAVEFAKDDHELTKDDVKNLPIRSRDEIGDLYHHMHNMQTRIVDYVDRLTIVTAERERTNTELQMAENIQRSVLPDEFPAFPDRKEFNLYASMTPAKVVGGDFYDFFLMDEDHLAVLIADVSDKGFPAALFMMSAMNLISYRAQQGGTPGEILTEVNAHICKNNKSKMFVTVWMGVLDLKTGVMTCTNAGHEYPFIRIADKGFSVYKDKHGLVVGALPNIKYKDYELKLEPGDGVFVYTDGVPEAINAAEKFYGMERLEKTLNNAVRETPQGIIDAVKSDVEAFVDGAKQFDDLTMLCIEYKGSRHF